MRATKRGADRDLRRELKGLWIALWYGIVLFIAIALRVFPINITFLTANLCFPECAYPCLESLPPSPSTYITSHLPHSTFAMGLCGSKQDPDMPDHAGQYNGPGNNQYAQEQYAQQQKKEKKKRNKKFGALGAVAGASAAC